MPNFKPCMWCGGSGKVEVLVNGKFVEVDCKECNGTGRVSSGS